jgi:hypothetical protein
MSRDMPANRGGYPNGTALATYPTPQMVRHVVLPPRWSYPSAWLSAAAGSEPKVRRGNPRVAKRQAQDTD